MTRIMFVHVMTLALVSVASYDFMTTSDSPHIAVRFLAELKLDAKVAGVAGKNHAVMGSPQHHVRAVVQRCPKNG